MGKDPSCLILQRPSVLSDVIVPKDIMALLSNSLPLMSKISNFSKLESPSNPIKERVI